MPEDDARVDPRYDPAFQRGFDGAVTSGLRSRAVQRPALVTPAPYRTPHPESVPATEEPERQLPAVHTVDQSRPAADDGDEIELASTAGPRRLSRNPFLIALSLLGTVMVVGGIGWASQARAIVATRGGASTDLDYWFLQATAVAAPMTILTGVGILAGVMFVAATAWNRRP